ncbi:YfiR family protein [Thioflexithrix psekupsensis]|uniref:YfiR family protein n=1 Tax=Thioflexithrix psekupsensis TaxID=1570016 RepID=UPI00159343EA|nr:YfiR family protein [Thioflexithrix psekupsensis]
MHSGSALANTSVADEYQVKAVFLYNFANFVKWPEKAFSDDDSFYICVYGKDPFKKNLDIAVQGEKVQGRHILIKRSNLLAELLNCQVLFVSDSEASDLKNILKDIGNRPILTVSDIVDFAQAGGIIEFYLQSSNVRLMVNLAAARQVDLVISANLLRVSKIVKE